MPQPQFCWPFSGLATRGNTTTSAGTAKTILLFKIALGQTITNFGGSDFEGIIAVALKMCAKKAGTAHIIVFCFFLHTTKKAKPLNFSNHKD